MTNRVREAMIVDIARGITTGRTPEQIADMLLTIPELGRAADAPLDPVKLLTAAADYLDDGYHERTVDELRGIAADLETLEAG